MTKVHTLVIAKWLKTVGVLRDKDFALTWNNPQFARIFNVTGANQEVANDRFVSKVVDMNFLLGT